MLLAAAQPALPPKPAAAVRPAKETRAATGERLRRMQALTKAVRELPQEEPAAPATRIAQTGPSGL
jgi:hypothetical protein